MFWSLYSGFWVGSVYQIVGNMRSVILFPTLVCYVFIKVVLSSIVYAGGGGSDYIDILEGGTQTIKVCYKLILDLPNWQSKALTDITKADFVLYFCTFSLLWSSLPPTLFFCSFFPLLQFRKR